jgi:hypothetical protein
MGGGLGVVGDDFPDKKSYLKGETSKFYANSSDLIRQKTT